jgi:hypothetical protein
MKSSTVLYLGSLPDVVTVSPCHLAQSTQVDLSFVPTILKYSTLSSIAFSAAFI